MEGRTISRYTVLQKIGEGGMGVVYKARDLRLDRFVALKFPPSQFLTSEQESRFQREALAISSLNHPHIATIFDLDEADGGRFLVLEYLPGNTLRSRLSKLHSAGEQMPVEQILDYGMQIGDALAHGHRWGVIHQDLKPENVMFSAEGALKLTDFGLAHWRGGAGAIQTEPPLGTAAYASPEQAQGLQSDHRSDIFSFGVLLFEMTTGELPFQAPDDAAQLYKVVHIPAPPVDKFRRDVPAGFQQIIHTALEKKPERRYQQVEQLLEDLQAVQKQLQANHLRTDEPKEPPSSRPRRLSRLLGRVTGRGQREHPVARKAALGGEPPAPERLADTSVGAEPPAGLSSIAVLPFVNMSPSSENDYLSDGLTEELIHALTQVKGLRVVAPTTAFHFRGRAQDIRSIREELKVDTIFHGSVRKAAEKLRITVKLVNTRDGAYLWSETYDRDLRDVFAIQEEMAQVIVKELQVQLAADRSARLIKPSTENLAAYHLYLKGRYYWNQQTPLALKRCIKCFEEAIGQEPRYALAYAGLADAYNLIGTWAVLPPREVMQKAKTAALTAQQLDETLAEAHTPLGFVRAVYDWDFTAAEREFQRALAFNPGYATAHHAYAMSCLAPCGRLDEAFTEMKRALELDPLSLFINANFGLALNLARRYDEAVEQIHKTLDLEPNYYLAHLYLGWIYQQQGRANEAVAALEKSRALSGDSPFITGALGQAYAQCGRREAAQAIVGELEEKARKKYVSPLGPARVHAGLDNKPQAFHWLEKAHDDRSSWLILLKVDPAFDTLRGDDRFRELLQKVGLDQAAASS